MTTGNCPTCGVLSYRPKHYTGPCGACYQHVLADAEKAGAPNPRKVADHWMMGVKTGQRARGKA